jgi:hypothetical protein
LKQLFLAFLVVLIGAMGVTNTFAQKPPSGYLDARKQEKVVSSETRTKSKEEKKRLSGTVVAVDVESRTLIVKNWRGETTFDVAAAKLVRSVNLEDIRPGDRVVMSYAEEGSRKAAKAVIATPAKPKEENKTDVSKEATPLTEGPLKR